MPQMFPLLSDSSLAATHRTVTIQPAHVPLHQESCDTQNWRDAVLAHLHALRWDAIAYQPANTIMRRCECTNVRSRPSFN